MAVAFQTRREFGEHWERELVDELNRHPGWRATLQPIRFAPGVEHEIRCIQDEYGDPCSIRFVPDIFVSTPSRSFWIDAKSSMSRNGEPYLHVQRDVAKAGLQFQNLGMPLFYVWDGGLALTPREVVDSGSPNPGVSGGGGPYYRIHKACAWDWRRNWGLRPPPGQLSLP